MSTKYLNSENIMRKVYDPSTESLKTTTTAVLDANTVITGDVSLEINAADGDSIAVVGTENGSPSGVQHTLKIGPDGNARVGDNFSLIPTEIDQITFTSVTVDGDPLIIEYRKSGVLVATLTITYDINGNFQSVTRT